MGARGLTPAEGATTQHEFVEPSGARRALVWRGLAGLLLGLGGGASDVLAAGSAGVAHSSLPRACAMPGCGLPQRDPIHAAAEERTTEKAG